METRILSIDPSGTGTTGIYYRNGEQELFFQFTSQDWKEHLTWIVEQTQALKPDLVIYEHTNFISLRGKDMTSLLKLLGVIETFPLQTKSIPVDQVKRLRNKLLKGEQAIAGITYQAGKGWHHNQKKISVHCLDAYLAYWLWQSKANNQLKSKPASQSIASNKNKAKLKKIDIEEEWPELPEPEIECPGSLCSECGEASCICWLRELQETKDHD